MDGEIHVYSSNFTIYTFWHTAKWPKYENQYLPKPETALQKGLLGNKKNSEMLLKKFITITILLLKILADPF